MTTCHRLNSTATASASDFTDHSKGLGAFARADGTNEHHSVFWVNSALPMTPGKPGYMHTAFGLEDIDEVMLGANLMAKRGWVNSSPNSSGGLSRHRISSAIYYYIDNPNGGEAEYHCDTDYVDDNWVARAWDWKFGSLLWAHKTPSFFDTTNENWDMTFDPQGKSLEAFRRKPAAVGREIAMFEYFPNNYVWNLSVNIALESGAKIGEIDEMCRPLREAAARGEDAGTADFFATWVAMADKLVSLAREDQDLGRNFSASTKLNRAALYYQTAERMQSHSYAPRKVIFQKGQDAFRLSMKLGRENYERIEIPYEGGIIPGFVVWANSPGKPAPLVVYVNGLDSSKEMLYWSGLAHELARRGVSTLHIDQPGTGEALRVHNLIATYDSERWASKVFDYVETRKEVDVKRVGLAGISLGGYYTPRAVAFEPRFALGAVWGANHNWGEVQHRRVAREGDRPVPHYWEHVQWVWGAKQPGRVSGDFRQGQSERRAGPHPRPVSGDPWRQ